jgi:hypothetical protein
VKNSGKMVIRSKRIGRYRIAGMRAMQSAVRDAR